ncbi:MAG TPA: glycosyltransferase [Chthonomonadales bacterium]|nr:glycosyltransferase [Chthonomonadales bacterium]
MALRLTYLVSGLNVGGAEMMLYKLLSRIDRTRFEPQVLSMSTRGAMGEKIAALGVQVTPLGFRPGKPNLYGLGQLVLRLRRERPDILQTWMYHADLIGGLAARMAGGLLVAWGIRSSTLDPQTIKRSTIWTAKACARLSRTIPTRIICCSEVAREVHARLGYTSEKMVVIPNGFDLCLFRPDPMARAEVRRELNIPAEVPLIGLVGRLDPQKDHATFFRAAGLLHRHYPDVHYLLCGDGVTWESPNLARWVEDAGVRERCRLLGYRQDIPRLTAALDIAVLSSAYGDAFPNVVGEAMACGVPCVVTDVGDSAAIVGETGRVVPPRNPERLAGAMAELVEMGMQDRQALGEAARKRAEECYSLTSCVTRYEKLYEEMMQPCVA